MSWLPRFVSDPLTETISADPAAVEPPAGGEAVVVLVASLAAARCSRRRSTPNSRSFSGACFITRLTLPPIESPSMSGVSAFETSIDCSSSDGTTSTRDLADQRIGRRDALAVDHHRVEPRLGAADDDVTALALILGDRDAGNALRGFGGVAVGKRADLIGRDDVGDVRRRLLLVERALLRVENQLLRAR